MRAHFAAVLILCAIAQSTPQRQITADEASALVKALLRPDGWTKLPGFVLYQALFEGQFKDFYFIHAEWNSPSGRHAAIGHYAVERSTGDVWDWVKCGEFKSPSLTSAQQSVRKRIGLTDSEYQHIRKPGPFCEPNERPQPLQMGRPPKPK